MAKLFSLKITICWLIISLFVLFKATAVCGDGYNAQQAQKAKLLNGPKKSEATTSTGMLRNKWKPGLATIKESNKEGVRKVTFAKQAKMRIYNN